MWFKRESVTPEVFQSGADCSWLAGGIDADGAAVKRPETISLMS